MLALTNSGQRAFRSAPDVVARSGVRVLRRVADAAPVRQALLRRRFYERRGLTGHTLLVELEPV
jgi:hypothetical protein